jgi:hypothetical protein
MEKYKCPAAMWLRRVLRVDAQKEQERKMTKI